MKTASERAYFAYEYFKRMRDGGTNEADAFITACAQVVVEAQVETEHDMNEAASMGPL